MKKSHINHSKLHFSCDAGAADVNVFTGRLLFEGEDISIGANSYALDITHIYDSAAINSGENVFGCGWKLNIGQSLSSKYENGQRTYFYKDAYGYEHEFVLLEEASGEIRYYDTTGLGLILHVGNHIYIEDAQGGRMVFELHNGEYKLARNISGRNSSIAQYIEYNEKGQISAYYDGRKAGRKIVFSYEETSGRLKEMSCSVNTTKIKMYYGYDSGGDLVSVRKEIDGVLKYTAVYSYTRHLLKYAVYIETDSCLRFTYDEDGRIVGVTDGLMKTNFRYGKPYAALYACDTLFSGTNKFSGQQQRKFLGYTVSEDDSDFQQGENSSGLGFGASQTTVTNGKGVKTSYFFNEKGFTTGILEQAAKSRYKTLFKQTGVRVSGLGTGDSINGNKASRCLTRYNFPSDKKAAANDFFEKDINKKNYDYVLSFWVKLEAEQTENVKAKLCLNYKCADVKEMPRGKRLVNIRYVEEFSASTMLDCTAQGGWQYVTIPFSFVKNYYTADLYKNFQEICHIELENCKGYFDIADVRITPGRVPVFTLVDDDQESVLTMEQVDTIRYKLSDGSTGGGNIAKDFFMTDSDITQTCMELIKARAGGNGTEPYTFVCNAGTKKIAKVTETTLSGNGKSVTLGFTADVPLTEEEKSKLSDEEKDRPSAYYSGTFYVPNYKTATEPSSGDNRVYNFTAYKINNHKIDVIRQHTHAIKYPDGASESAQRKSNEYTWQNLYGDTLKKRDAYGVTTEGSYDTYGNLTQTVVRYENVPGADDNDESGTDETITEKYLYSDDKELLTGRLQILPNEKEFCKQTYETDPVYGILQKSGQASASNLASNANEYRYNSYKDKLQEVKLSANGKEYGKNTLVYGANGRLTELYPSEGCRYNIEYDGFGKATKFSLNGVTLLTKEYNAEKNWVEARYHRSENEADRLRTQYDRYGRVKELTNNGSPLLETEYEDEAGGFAESPSCANIKSMTDHCTGETYTYDYDEYTGRPTKYAVVSDADGKEKMTVQCIGSNKTKYWFDTDWLKYEDELIYDADVLLSPRVTEFKNEDQNFGIGWTFGYDALGRYNKRSTLYLPDLDITYKSGTGLKETMSYVLPSRDGDAYAYSEKITNTYDARGNITEVHDQYSNSRKGNAENYDTETVTKYEYDDVNRLIKEENGACGFTREYSYTSEGNIASIKETQGTGTSETEEYEYTAGRLTSVKKDGSIIEKYTYDQYGNPTHFKSETQNMWWERGTFLKQYGDITYTYDGQGRLHGKSVKLEGGEGKEEYRTSRMYYDGDKLIAMEIGDKILRFFYDPEGLAGFKIGIGERYTYTKDCQGNVIGLADEYNQTVRYVYDAWGNSIALDKDGEEITEWDDPAILNPIRWKSRYYDADTGLYLIGERWYDPETGRYVSAASPETLLENASVVFALNLYAFCTANPIAVILASSTFLPELDFYYNGEYKTWWEKNSWWVWLIVGAAATVIACVAAPFMCGASSAIVAIGTTLAKIALGTAVGAGVSLAIGGTIAGIQAALTGHGFWQAFGDSVSENFVDAIVTSFAFTAVSIAASNLIQTRCCFKEGTLVETEEGLKPIEEIEVGDKVLAYDEETGEQAYKPVVQLFRNTTEEWQYVYIEGETEPIISTPGHKYYLPENYERREDIRPQEHASYASLSEKWVSACNLKKGDRVLLSDGKYGIVEKTFCVKLSASETTYNFEVADSHTYYVGSNGVLVHNADCHKLGKEGEQYVSETRGIEKNKQLIDKKRIPDFLTKETLIESKNVARQSFTKQLRDYLEIAQQSGRTMELYVRQGTKLSKNLLNSGIKIKFFPW